MGKIFITIQPAELWKTLNVPRIYKGDGSPDDPKMVRKGDRLRPNDFDVRWNEERREFWVYPNPTKGLSFSTTIQRIKDLGIEGAVWQLDAPAQIPDKLVINFQPPDHPLINVAEEMPLVSAIHLLRELGRKMTPSGYTVKKGTLIPK